MRVTHVIGGIAIVAALLSGAVVANAQDQKVRTPEDIAFLAEAYEFPGPGVVAPKALLSTHPKYTADAMRAKIQGTVELQVVVGAKGTVERARVIQSLDQVYGLDREALAAAAKWTFVPGTVNGKPAPVAVALTLEFRLH